MDRSSSASAVRRITPPREDQNTGFDDGKCIYMFYWHALLGPTHIAHVECNSRTWQACILFWRVHFYLRLFPLFLFNFQFLYYFCIFLLFHLTHLPTDIILAQIHTHSGFVVHRGRIIPTLASMQEPLPAARSRQSKERTTMDTKNDDRGKYHF